MTREVLDETAQNIWDDQHVEIAVDHVTGHPEGIEYHETKKHKIRLGTYIISDSGEGGSHEVVVTRSNIKYMIGQLLEGSTFLHD